MRLLERSIEQAGLANIKPRVSKSMATTSIASLLKSYSVPLVLLSLAVFLQLVVIPSSFPLSHYDVLGIKRDSSIEEVKEAYEKLSARWNSGVEIPVTVDFIKIRYAFELLTNPLWKSDYDNFGIDEQLDVVEKVKGKYLGKSFSEIDLPLLDTSNSGTGGDIFNVITTEDFKTTIGRNKAWLIQVYSSGSSRCAQFSNDWKRIAGLLDGVAGTGIVELGEVELASYLAETRTTGQPFFRNGLPSLVVFPPGCRSSSCLLRYQGDLLVDAVVDWFATTVLGLPRILYYSKESLGQKFLAKSGHHKVKVIFFSKTGERAAPILRQAAKDYWAYASFAFVLWREDESSTWWNMFEVESAPAVVFLKDPGVKPVVHHGAINSSEFLNIVEQNKYQDLPQLRSVTSMELGCDARAYSRAGNDTTTWYCVILAGRLSMELNKMRETMRRVQDMLRNDVKSTAANNDLFTSSIPAAEALKKKRLTFTWLDGEEQKVKILFLLPPFRKQL
ncbi:dnaJ homolog subfamily C member 16 isoform X3 [Telopea speciosissima]|uniref:dnaJ homolog subfamily C member 16 isoform X3 n=1 Tax=Telopea speciosissima TaxID=54955 RepID=UPI001CC63D9B|nr:dnaJ homolog subfamily C member 16 isoform X3 [Telopea speciosissima]